MEKNIINEIRDFLDKSGVNTVQLAKQLGCPYCTVSRWLNGHQSPSPVWQRAIRSFIKKHKKSS